MRVLPMSPRPSGGPARDDPAVVVGGALRRAREVRGLDLVEAADRVDLALGCTIVNATLYDLWERGAAQPTAAVFVVAVKALAGAQAAAILASLAS